MDRLTGLRVFREVAEAGSFVAASERLDMSPPMVSKHIARLELDLGARLLNRTSRRVSLTEAGTVYLEHCRDALDALQAGEAELGRGRATPRGLLKVSAPDWCGNRHIAEVLAAYRNRHPGVVVDIRLENRRVDLAAEGFDLALRATYEPSPMLIARPICVVPFVIVASPGYINTHGPANAPSDLLRYRAILPTYVNHDRWNLEGPHGAGTTKMTAAMKSDDTNFVRYAVRAGIGVAVLPLWLVRDDLADGTLIQLLPDHKIAPPTLWAVYTSRRFLTPKVRTFIDHFTEALGQC